jgi:ATP-binding cassette, subfamily C (CFTR/MRP), member 1
LRAIWYTFPKDILLVGACRLPYDFLQVFQAFVLRYVIRALIEDGNTYSAECIGTSLALVFMVFAQSVCGAHFGYYGGLLGIKVRGALVSLTFEKSFRLSVKAKADPTKRDSATEPSDGWTDANIATLISNDTLRLAHGCYHINGTWTLPCAFVLTFGLVCAVLDFRSAMVGFSVVLVFLSLLIWGYKIQNPKRRAMNSVTEERINLTQEVLTNIKFIKFSGWEQYFLNQMSNIRNREANILGSIHSIRVISAAISLSLPVFACIVSLVTYTYLKKLPSTADAFTVMALFNCMRNQLSVLPQSVNSVLEGRSAIQRLEGFLFAGERSHVSNIDKGIDNAIEVREADFTWHEDQLTKPQAKSDSESIVESLNESIKHFRLESITFNVRRGELLAIVGVVGSGKSSLIAALAGDMKKVCGDMKFIGTQAVCAQTPWIQNATARNNIVFGREFNPEKYARVIQACKLEPDFAVLTQGDKTQIGERGITLSGGQKQRISLARAAYSDAPIVILDDPLSAIDPHVGEHIFNHTVRGILKDRTRILATHQIRVLAQCDRVLWLENGMIRAIGPFDSLYDQHQEFRDLTIKNESKGANKEDHGGNDRSDKPNMLYLQRSAEKETALLVQEKDYAIQAVEREVWYSYFKISGGLPLMLLTAVLLIPAVVATATPNIWLALWLKNQFMTLTKERYMLIYGFLGIAQFIFLWLFMTSLNYSVVKASTSTVNQAMNGVIHAPMQFFETTPTGGIINRFTKDVEAIDSRLADAARLFLLTLAILIGALIFLITKYHYFAIYMVIGTIGVIWLVRYVNVPTRELKRHEAMFGSIVFSKVYEAIDGTSTIRAYGAQDNFFKIIYTALDDMSTVQSLRIAAQRWLNMRLDFFGNMMLVVAMILVLNPLIHVNPNLTAAILAILLPVVQLVQKIPNQFAEMENAMNSFERLDYYMNKLVQEDVATEESSVPPSEWPLRSEIKFDNIELRYREELPLVLSGFQLHIHSGEHIAIMGRTGSGKSSVIAALSRHVPLAKGAIRIDGIDIRSVPLKLLRSEVAIMPQDATLFRGTIRSNLDPLGEYSDLELWDALRKSALRRKEGSNSSSGSYCLEKSGGAMQIDLDDPVEEHGGNFSQGQKQLLSLARVLLRRAKIVVFDEATSSLDFNTDRSIQEVMKIELQNRTVICIAHRLESVLHYDRICVIDAGKVVEIDTPVRLYDKKGHFFRMCEKSRLTRERVEQGLQ